jgi:hypothetical protein
MKFELKEYRFKSELRAVVVDNIGGAYVPIAHRMSDFFDKVYYHSVNQSPFPRISLDKIGIGYDDIERLDDFWSSLSLFDVVIFTDIYFSDWGERLRKIGKLVWGGCQSDVIETDRKLFKDELSNVGMLVAPTKYINGITDLLEYLKGSKDKWIKMSYYRGEMETFHHINWSQSQVWADDLKREMGPLGETVEFIIEDSIDSIAEVGYDGYCINGIHPQSALWGLEVKDCCYVGKQSLNSDMPQPVQYVNTTFSPVLQKYKHTGFYSTEIRYTKDGDSYYTDPCLRAGSPPSNTYLDMIDNWDDIIVEGAKGNVVEPKFRAKYGVEIILKSGHATDNYLPVSFDPKYSKNVKLKGSFYINDSNYIIPFKHAGIDMSEFGSVVVVGDDLPSIVNQALEIASNVECYGINYDNNALDKAMETLSKVEEALKIKF